MSVSKIVINKDKITEFSEWYPQVVFETDMLGYYDVSGCYIMMPYSCKTWELIHDMLDKKFKKMKVDNVYFPLLITDTNLKKESSHIAGFTPEVVWVEKKEGSDVKLAIRPTSECGIYNTFSKVIKSHSDLPMRWNQWCNVMRWEFTSPTPFIRSREFLWQEGHSAYKTKEETDKECLDILDIYHSIYNDVLCVPVFKGEKIDSEKFAGADRTYSIETYIPEAGKGIQCATAHNLGQNFSKIFDIKYQEEKGSTNHVYQASWGFTTRSIGVSVMTHSDNKGLVMPPKIAPVQIAIVPIYDKKSKEEVLNYCNTVVGFINPDDKYRIEIDLSDRKSGWKYYYWEAKGVPFRLELGKNDIKNNQVVVYNRATDKKETHSLVEFRDGLNDMFALYEKTLREKALKNILCGSMTIDSKENMDNIRKDGIEGKHMYVVSACDKVKNNKDCEDKLKELSNDKVDFGKVLCRLFTKFSDSGKTCVVCGCDSNLNQLIMSKSF